MTDIKTIYLIIPCYNEEQVLAETAKRLKLIVESLIEKGKISTSSKICFVDDGSKDNTWKIIKDLHFSSEIFSGIKLAMNKGHQNALMSGLMMANEYADAIISMDCDLQDDINVIEQFIDKYYTGIDIVYGVRKNRKKDTFFKKGTAKLFYNFMSFLGVDIIKNHADYRLMSKRVVNSLSEFKEVNLFLRGVIPMIGYTHDIVYYERNERFAGESKYPLKKMISFAIDGITSFSIKPIRWITILGFLIFTVSIILLIYFLIIHLTGKTVQGFTTIVLSVWAIGGIQILAIGIIGEYIGKIYMETKKRPRYIIEEFLNK